MGKHRTETRQFVIDEIRANDDTGEISGYAAVFDQKADIGDIENWGYQEVIRKGAFAKNISDGADVFAFWNHDTGSVLGRTKNGTLDLREDDHGLKVTINPPDTPTAQEVRKLIKDGYVDKMSFGFSVLQQNWVEEKGQPDLREIKEVRLYEVSPVPIPAYDGTSVQARNKTATAKDGEPLSNDENHSGQASPEPERKAKHSINYHLERLKLKSK